MNKLTLKMESEANAFALALLIPKEMLLKEIDAYKSKRRNFSKDRFIKYLSVRFAVSVTAMTSRLYDLGFINEL